MLCGLEGNRTDLVSKRPCVPDSVSWFASAQLTTIANAVPIFDANTRLDVLIKSHIMWLL